MSAPGPLSPAQEAAIAKSQKEGRAIALWSVGIFCVYCWDYLICFPKEVKYVWRKRLSPMSCLYLVDRYFGLIQGAVAIWIMGITNTGSQAKTCQKIFLWQPVGAFILTFLSHAIMTSRVYAVYNLSKIILGVLSTIMAAELAVQIYTITVAFPAPAPAPGIPVPCVGIGPTQWLVAFWSMPLVFDAVTFTLTIYKTYLYWKQDIHTSTITLIFRDGLIYFGAIFSMNLINVVLFTTQDSGLQSVNLPATVRLNVIMACRMVLNLRKPHAKLHVSGGNSFSLNSRGGRQTPILNISGKLGSVDNYRLSSTPRQSLAVEVKVMTRTDTVHV